MSKEITKGYRIPATLLTLNNSQEYPVADMEDIAGGYHVVKKLDEMFYIPRLHRRVGMICYVINEDSEYRLIINSGTNRTSLDNWEKIERNSGGSGGGASIDLSRYVTKTMFEPIRDAVENLPDFATYVTKTELQITKNNINTYIDNQITNVINNIPDVSQFLIQTEIEDLIYDKIDEKNAEDDVTQDEIDDLF